MRLPLARRIAAAALLLAWSAAVLQDAASREAPTRKQSGPPAKVLVARKVPLPGHGAAALREAPAEDALAGSVPAPTAASREELTQPTYLRIFFSGMPHGHRDPPG